MSAETLSQVSAMESGEKLSEWLEELVYGETTPAGLIAKAERGKIRPVFSHLKNLIFLLITFAMNLNRFIIKLLKTEG